MREFEYTGKAMGTDYSVSIVCDSENMAENLYTLAKNYINTFEEKFSRFKPESELSLLNTEGKMTVSEDFLNTTLKAKELFTETRGIFNPLVQISRFGYTESFEKNNPNKILNYDDNYDIDFSTTILNLKESSVQLKAGQKLDYGGFLKGYLAEIIAKKIKSYSSHVSGVIINLGGDIHTQGLDENGNKFTFEIYNPVSKKSDTTVELFNQSLATSGTYKRSWINSGKNMHHILDSTGKCNPESNVISATVICTDGARAEAYAKVFLSLGVDNTIKQLGDKSMSYILIDNLGNIMKNI